MSNIINLRQVRKARARDDKARLAEENRARFGRTKAQRLADRAEDMRKADRLEGARREPGRDIPSKDDG